jgi:adenylate cyclase
MASTRRLAAILAADVAGYSRLMGADEEGTHERLKAVRRQLIDPKIGEHRGRIVKTTGDGLLAEFPSVVDAVRCAAEVQRGMLDREPELSGEQQIRFRIGINLGDVIAEGGDIFGDGVNVAARLEALAEPGGICVSGTVREHIRGKLSYPLEDQGEQSVKNIAIPVRVHALRPEAIADLPATGLSAGERHRRSVPLVAVGAAVLVLLVIAVGAWWLWPATKPAPTPAVTAATSIAQPLVAPRLSIVVLPFANLSTDPEQQYFADGITDDLTTGLSLSPDMFVISRNSAFTYRDKSIDTKQIGHELGVRYVLEGGVRRSGNKVRVNAQLIEADTDAHLWAEQFDGDMSDLFAVQNEITSRIAVALNVELINREAARPTENPDALDYILRGRAIMNSPITLARRAEAAEATSLFERALALDPHSVEAKSLLATRLAVRARLGWTDSPAADMQRAEELVGQALAAAPSYWWAHDSKATILRFLDRCEEAIVEYQTVLALNPNRVNALDFLAWCKLATGSIEEVIPIEEQAIRLSPRDPFSGNFYLRIGQVHLLQSRPDQAIGWFERALAHASEPNVVHAWLAAAYALKGDGERAAVELSEAQRLARDARFSNIARMKADGWLGGPGYWGCRRSALCSRLPILPACGRPGCRRIDRPRVGGDGCAQIATRELCGIMARIDSPERVGCWSHGLDPPSRRDPRRRCGGLLAPDGCGRGRYARATEGAFPAAGRSEDRGAPGPHRQENR